MTPIQEAREALDRASHDVLEIPIPSGKDHRALADAVPFMFRAAQDRGRARGGVSGLATRHGVCVPASIRGEILVPWLTAE
jgi:hypothetical protein